MHNSIKALTLQEVHANFEQWRSTRTKKGKIPEVLWQQVLTLLKMHIHSIGEVSKVLKLSGSQVKEKIQQSTNSTKPPDFIAVKVPHSLEEVEPFSGKIEIKRADGATISIERLNQNVLTDILTQFLRGL